MRFLAPPDRGNVATSARATKLEGWFEAWLRGETSGAPPVASSTVRVTVAGDYDEVERAIRESTHDLVWTPPLVCARVRKLPVRAILASVRDGETETVGAFVVRSDYEARSISALRGARAAWVAKSSVSGYLAARATLRAEGHDPDGFFAEETFHGTYHRALLAVLGGVADVAAVYAGGEGGEAAAMEAIEDLLGYFAHDLRTVGRTLATPNDALVIPPGTDEALADAMVERLAFLRGDVQPTPTLLEICRCEGFQLVMPDAYASLAARLTIPPGPLG